MHALKPRREHGPVSTKQYRDPDGRNKIPNLLSLPLDQFVSSRLQENAAPTTESRRGSQQSTAKPELTDLFGPAKSGRRTSTGTEAHSPAPAAAAPSPAKPLALRQGVATSPVPAAPGSGSVGTSASKGVASKKEREPVIKANIETRYSDSRFQPHPLRRTFNIMHIYLSVYIYFSLPTPNPCRQYDPLEQVVDADFADTTQTQNPCGSSLETARGPQGL